MKRISLWVVIFFAWIFSVICFFPQVNMPVVGAATKVIYGFFALLLQWPKPEKETSNLNGSVYAAMGLVQRFKYYAQKDGVDFYISIGGYVFLSLLAVCLVFLDPNSMWFSFLYSFVLGFPAILMGLPKLSKVIRG